MANDSNLACAYQDNLPEQADSSPEQEATWTTTAMQHTHLARWATAMQCFAAWEDDCRLRCLDFEVEGLEGRPRKAQTLPNPLISCLEAFKP